MLSSNAGLSCGTAAQRQQVRAPRCAALTQELSQARTAGFDSAVMHLQKSIIERVESLDGSGKTFRQDPWVRDGGGSKGYGTTAVLQGGEIVEKGAVNTTCITGTLSAARAQTMSARGRDIDPEGGQPYAATAMSLVLHSAHPFIPTLRADVRVFEVNNQRWFGGGCDLTPFYLVDDDIAQFHNTWKGVCDGYQPDGSLYSAFKAECDKYFYIPARKEHRGTGGLFFDDLQDDEQPFDVEAFVLEVGETIVPSWEPVVGRQRGREFSDEQRHWQLLRRGRYIEFNLLYDRGVKFGLEGGRIESIMVSAPPLVAWEYDVVPEPGSEEARLVEVLQKPREWV